MKAKGWSNSSSSTQSSSSGRGSSSYCSLGGGSFRLEGRLQNAGRPKPSSKHSARDAELVSIGTAMPATLHHHTSLCPGAYFQSSKLLHDHGKPLDASAPLAPSPAAPRGGATSPCHLYPCGPCPCLCPCPWSTSALVRAGLRWADFCFEEFWQHCGDVCKGV